MIKKQFLFITIIFLPFSCVNKNVYSDIVVNDQYIITVPDYLQPCTDLHKKASLQLQNINKDVYMVIIDEKKLTMRDFNVTHTLDDYFNNIVNQPFLKQIKYPVVEKIPLKKNIFGNNALISSINGLVNNYRVYYKFAIIETPNYFYQIIIWTRTDKRIKLEAVMDNMIDSFKEEKIKNTHI